MTCNSNVKVTYKTCRKCLRSQCKNCYETRMAFICLNSSQKCFICSAEYGMLPFPINNVDRNKNKKEKKTNKNCLGDRCLKPNDKKNLWIQCEDCEIWYHIVCVGISKSDINEIDAYICDRCDSADVISDELMINEA